MYLEHFKFKEMPFGLTPNVGFFCNLKGHEEALNVLLFSLRCGEGFIKIVGEVGSGKTLLCRKLLDSLGDDYVTAYIPNPDLAPNELRRALARELGIPLTDIQDQHELLTHIYDRLLELQKDKRVVLLLDEAQALPLESLETLRLLTNIETEKTKLMQIVLFGQPELDEHLAKKELRQLQQRITFSYYLPPMTREDLDLYLFHRLSIVGHVTGTLFAKKARKILYRASQGIPRVVNILCHKALLVAYGRGETIITTKSMRAAIKDNELVISNNNRVLFVGLFIFITFVSAVLALYYYEGII